MPTWLLNLILYSIPLINWQLTPKSQHGSLGSISIKPDLIKIPGLPFAVYQDCWSFCQPVVQFLSSKMMMPEVLAEKKIAKITEEKNRRYHGRLSGADAVHVSPHDTHLWLPISWGPSLVLVCILVGFWCPTILCYWLGGLTPWIRRLGLLK